MFQNVHAVVGIIELTNSSDQATRAVDDSTLDCLLASLVSHDSLADEVLLPEAGSEASWRRTGDDTSYIGRTSVSADLAELVTGLEREYAQLCDSLGD